jgi:hypothetical protein
MVMTTPDKPMLKCKCGETMLDGSYCGYYCPKGFDCPASAIHQKSDLPDEVYLWVVPSGFHSWSPDKRKKGKSTKYIRADLVKERENGK